MRKQLYKAKTKKAELEALMNDRGIPSIGNLAARLGLSNSAISMLFSGQMRPSATTAANICVELGIKPPRLYELLGLEDTYRLGKAVAAYQRNQGYVLPTPNTNGPEIMHEMYKTLLQRLTLRYEAGTPFVKLGILSTLDNLVRKYQRANEAGSESSLPTSETLSEK